MLELVYRPAVEIGGRDHMVTRLADCQYRCSLCRMPGTDLQRCHAAFQVGDALLQHVAGWVANTGVDIAFFLESK